MNDNIIKNNLAPTELKTADFTYDLPEELIAKEPAEPRDSARLLTVNRASHSTADRIFRDITEYLKPSDTLVINDSRVIPARLIAKTAKGADVELLLLRRLSSDPTAPTERWSCLAGPGKRARPGDILTVTPNMTADVEAIAEEGCRIVAFETSDGAPAYDELHRAGKMPLPPYIDREVEPEDAERYQTVYAKDEGSAAAPTAGLHFTAELLDKIRAMGVAVVPVMLHIGIGTFRPVKEENIADHVMHTEFFTVTESAARIINDRRAAGGRTVAVGTTSCRTLESAADDDGTVKPMSADTGIFIYPGYKFKAVDALITNFHLPESTLLMLVSAFAGREFMLDVYKKAVTQRYRFFSYGDAMFIE